MACVFRGRCRNPVDIEQLYWSVNLEKDTWKEEHLSKIWNLYWGFYRRSWEKGIGIDLLNFYLQDPANVFLHLFDLLHLLAWQWHWKFLQWKRKWGGIVKKLSERNHQRIIKFYGQMKNHNMYSLNYITFNSILWKNTTKIYNWLFRWRSHCHWVQ